MRVLDDAYQQQWGPASTWGDPRHPDTEHRTTATYNRWFRPTAGMLLSYAATHTSSKACAAVRGNLRLRLGAVETAVNKGRHINTAFSDRVCRDCERRAGQRCVDDAQHVCLECPYILGQLGHKGYDNSGARDFNELYAPQHASKGIRFVGKVVDLIAEAASRQREQQPR